MNQPNLPVDDFSDIPDPPPRRRLLAKTATTLLMLALGVAGAAGVIAASGAAEKGTPPQRIDLVEALTLQAGDAQARVQATGTVLPDQQIVLSPEVAGRITWVSNQLVPGGRLRAGDSVARIDSRDYQVAVDQAKVAVEQAQLELDLETHRGTVAAREWEILGEAASTDGRLARREPHLEVTRVNLEAARAGLRKAELALSRTNLRAPFNAIVLSESVDEGQVVGGGSPVATLAGTDRFRVDVSVPFDRLATLDVPGVGGIGEDGGSEAIVRQRLAGGGLVERRGQVRALGGQLDPRSRTANLIVVVDLPLEDAAGGLPLMIGAFVDVELLGRIRSEALSIPRAALYDGDTVWVVDAKGALERRQVEVGWALSEQVEVRSGLSAGDRVVVSPLSAPVAGSLVRIHGEDGAAAAAAAVGG